MLRRRTLILLAAALPAACASPNPNLYTLMPLPGPARSGAPKTIELRSVALARYLERSQIVRSSENFRLDVLGNDWWGEPLYAMLSRVLVQNLSQRLPGSTVLPENGAITPGSDTMVAVNMERLDADRGGAVILVAQASVGQGSNTATRAFRFSVTPPSAGTPGLVSGMSTAVAQLSDGIADMLGR